MNSCLDEVNEDTEGKISAYIGLAKCSIWIFSIASAIHNLNILANTTLSNRNKVGKRLPMQLEANTVLLFYIYEMISSLFI